MSSSVVSSREPLLAPQTGLHPISQMKTLWAGLPAPTLTVRGPGNLQELDINQLHQHTHTTQQQKKKERLGKEIRFQYYDHSIHKEG